MQLYRALKDLSTGQKRGSLVNGEDFPGVGVLVQKGALARASSPPLTELPGWQARAEILGKVGVVTIEDLLGMDPAEGTKLFRHRRKATFKGWVEHARLWLFAAPNSGCRGCNQ